MNAGESRLGVGATLVPLGELWGRRGWSSAAELRAEMPRAVVPLMETCLWGAGESCAPRGKEPER